MRNTIFGLFRTIAYSIYSIELCWWNVSKKSNAIFPSGLFRTYTRRKSFSWHKCMTYILWQGFYRFLKELIYQPIHYQWMPNGMFFHILSGMSFNQYNYKKILSSIMFVNNLFSYQWLFCKMTKHNLVQFNTEVYYQKVWLFISIQCLHII